MTIANNDVQSHSIMELTSALALDIYAWLAHRLHRITDREGSLVTWPSLKEQFGEEYRNDHNGRNHFRQEFLRVLNVVRPLYPGVFE